MMTRITVLAVLLALAMQTSGCSSTDRSVALAKQDVSRIAVGDATEVSAPVLAEALLRAGFDRDAVLEYGPRIRNALATAGGAQVRRGHVTEALLAVHAQRLYVTSRDRGTFVRSLSEPESKPSTTGDSRD